MWFKVVAAVILFVIAAFFFRQSFWYHRNFDEIIKIPFVFGSAFIGLFFGGLGLRILLPK